MKMNKIIGTFLILGMSSFFVACSGEKSSEASTDETNANAEITNTITDDASTANVTAETTTEVAANLAAIEFEETVHDFGNIKEGEVVEHIFKFKNVGETPLILTGVQPSCGCTASDFTKDPVAPGEEGTISLSFNSSGKVGAQNKTATVKANIEGGQTTISFKGNVEGAESKTSGAPYK
ncbi:DUF1573 domain-containing protein [Bernardetia sp. Wsw4-3y2]|uniref:DUF1573 domain-containing protein n=1 Tax=unclassified Bernardetia TaxID=2647129 RepID=UPI0030CE2EC4